MADTVPFTHKDDTISSHELLLLVGGYKQNSLPDTDRHIHHSLLENHVMEMVHLFAK